MRSVKLNKLTQLDVKNAGPNAILSDGGNLYLRKRLWVFRYASPITGRERDLSFGSRDALSLKSARAEAGKCRELIACGIDPRDDRDAKREEAKAEAAKKKTFGAVASLWMESKLCDRKSAANQRAIRAAIERHTKALANLPIASITSAMIADGVKPLKDRPAQRDHVVGLIHAVFDWAMAADIIPETLNPARRKKLGKLLPKRPDDRPVKHNRFVPLETLPAFMARLRGHQGNLARGLEFLIHTGLRTGEVVNLKWDWVSLEDRSITIPAAGMKAAKAHRIFLADRPYEIVMGMLPQRRALGLVFPGGGASGTIGLRSFRAFIITRFPELGAVQVHGARSSLKTWATTTAHRREIIEATLAHSIGGAVEAAYFHVDAPEVRAAREALYRDWSRFLTGGTPVEAPHVLPFRSSA
jgi:integrase